MGMLFFLFPITCLKGVFYFSSLGTPKYSCAPLGKARVVLVL